MSQERRGLPLFDSDRRHHEHLIAGVQAVLVLGNELQRYYRLSSLTHGDPSYVDIRPTHVDLCQLCIFYCRKASPFNVPLVLLNTISGNQQWLVLASYEQPSRIRFSFGKLANELSGFREH